MKLTERMFQKHANNWQKFSLLTGAYPHVEATIHQMYISKQTFTNWNALSLAIHAAIIAWLSDNAPP